MALTYIQKTVHPAPITLHESNGVAYFTFPLLEQTKMVRHAFSTRLGGASKGYFSTMNFSLTLAKESGGNAIMKTSTGLSQTSRG